MSNICLYKFEGLQNRSTFLEITYKGVNYVYFLGFKRNCFTPPKNLSGHGNFNKTRWFYLKFMTTLCRWVNPINLPKHQIIVKA